MLRELCFSCTIMQNDFDFVIEFQRLLYFFCGQLSICCICIYSSFPAVSNYEMLMKINEILSEYEKINSKVLNHIKIHRHIIIALNLSCYILHFSFKNTGARSLYLIKALYQQ